MNVMTLDREAAKHPLAGQEMSGADMIIQVLADQGVDTIFGYSGGAILPTYDAIFRYNAKVQPQDKEGPVRLIVPANEQGAGFMAAGYARASGKVGVFLVTSGPGATNCVTPIRDCMADSIPVVLICGQVPRAAMGSDAFQEAPVFNIMSSCAKHVFLVNKPEELEATVRTAFEIARTGRPGPVVIDVPKDVQNWAGQFQGAGLLDYTSYWERETELRNATPNDQECAEFFGMLGESRRPLLYVGGGVINSNAAPQLREFARRLQIPITTTLMGIGSFDNHDEMSLHMLGMHGTAFANYAVEDCDFLIAIGSRFDDRVAGKVQEFAPDVKYIVHIDIDAAEVGKVKAVDWSFVGYADRVLQALTEYARHKGMKFDHASWLQHVAQLREKYALNFDRESTLIQPQHVVEVLNEITGGEAIICTGVGQHQMWAAQYGHFKHPRSWLTSGSMGTMGFGLPSAIGAQVARPEKTVINIDGDGSLRMNLGELETATTYNLPVKVLLFNNLGDGMVRQWQKMYFGQRFSGSDKSLHRKDFVKAAEADGFGYAVRLTNKKKLKETLAAFIGYDGPAFLEVMIDPDACVFPIVGPGMGYKQMETGPHIPKRDYSGGEPIPELEQKPDLF